MASHSPEGTIKWRPEYSCGIESVDNQHQFLVGLIAEFQEAMLAGRAADHLDRLFTNLVTYTEYHFTWEEQLWRENDYGDLARHAEIHEQLRRQVLELQERFRAGKLRVGTPVFVFLRNWLLTHIQQEDREAAQCVKVDPESVGVPDGI